MPVHSEFARKRNAPPMKGEGGKVDGLKAAIARRMADKKKKK